MKLESKIAKIAEHYGLKNQLHKPTEELLELIKVISIVDKINTEDLIDEIADVLIMITQLVHLKNIDIKVGIRMDYKLDRQLKRIEKEKGEYKHD